MRKRIVLLSVALILLLSGCAQIDGYLEKILLQKSGILEDEDYQEYQRLAQENKINEDGYYVGEYELDGDALEQELAEGKIHVTFADNSYLAIRYCKDAELTQQIQTEACYLEPGDCIYLADAESNNPYSNLYKLSEFRIYEYDAEGNRKSQLHAGSAESGLIYQIPEDFEGTEISVVPIGKYQNRVIFLNDYYVELDGTVQTLTNIGKWEIDGEECKGDYAEKSLLGSYVVKYTYDTKNYFYVTSEPECFSQNSEEGVVQFYEEDTAEETKSYSVELHPYLKLSIQLDERGTICLNDDEAEEVKKNKTWTQETLKYGDKIIIETTGSYTIINGDYQYVQESTDRLSSGFRYTLEIKPENAISAENRKIYTVTLSTSAKYGNCIYTLDGEEVSGTTIVREGQKLKLKYTITASDYKFEQRSGGVIGFFQGLLNSSEQIIEIPITAELDGTTIRPDEKVSIVKKGD